MSLFLPCDCPFIRPDGTILIVCVAHSRRRRLLQASASSTQGTIALSHALLSLFIKFPYERDSLEGRNIADERFLANVTRQVLFGIVYLHRCSIDPMLLN
ncbi:hypothetical protein GUJ93_ZPchr0009g327 [Zizania palustris]|uniref:Uncharacterized protein n=1 Tax=Zizania palustris TaxID=103762 RepID=A0A8J5S6J5_ZIZPA|nr:hypothetical protein GUJ93_ZPchr0009g327 [Zizania palustris]